MEVTNPTAAAVSSLLFIIIKCYSLSAPLWWNDLLSLRAERLLVFQAENLTFYDEFHIVISLLSHSPTQLTHAALQHPADSTPLVFSSISLRYTSGVWLDNYFKSKPILLSFC